MRGLVEVGAELRERRQLAILRQVETQACRRSDFMALICALPPTRLTEMPTLMAGRMFELNRSASRIDLAVGDRNDVGRNVRRNVARLRFDERQGGQRAAAVFVVQLGGALQQAAVQIEHVAGKRLASRRTAQQQRDFAIGRGVLGKIVVDAERVAARCRGSTRPWRSRR